MGYESRLIVVEKHHSGYVGKIAEFNLCKVAWSPDEVFKTPIDFDLYDVTEMTEDGHWIIGETKKDRYGDHCKMAKIADVINLLEKYEAKDSYRRQPPVLGMLKGFNPYLWDDLWVVHYGY